MDRTVKLIAIAMALTALMWGGWSSMGYTADWISPVPEEANLQSDWVATINNELSTNEDLRWIFTNDPRAPQSKIIRYLNRAAAAMKAGNSDLAKSYVDRAFELIEQGVDLGYYSESDKVAVEQMIKKHLPQALV
ncbi:MAG: hypothetical protein D6690_05420 [Nitrospirae bacterium]|nr:MAG: hypothetical protein D6690_05420 [Nitrospirota bacterium]